MITITTIIRRLENGLDVRISTPPNEDATMDEAQMAHELIVGLQAVMGKKVEAAGSGIKIVRRPRVCPSCQGAIEFPDSAGELVIIKCPHCKQRLSTTT